MTSRSQETTILSPQQIDLSTLLEQINEALVKKRESIRREIYSYPPPIPACDAQYNHLLEERATITREVNWIGRILAMDVNESSAIRAIQSFADSTTHVDMNTKRQLQSWVEAAS